MACSGANAALTDGQDLHLQRVVGVITSECDAGSADYILGPRRTRFRGARDLLLRLPRGGAWHTIVFRGHNSKTELLLDVARELAPPELHPGLADFHTICRFFAGSASPAGPEDLRAAPHVHFAMRGPRVSAVTLGLSLLEVGRITHASAARSLFHVLHCLAAAPTRSFAGAYPDHVRDSLERVRAHMTGPDGATVSLGRPRPHPPRAEGLLPLPELLAVLHRVFAEPAEVHPLLALLCAIALLVSSDAAAEGDDWARRRARELLQAPELDACLAVSDAAAGAPDGGSGAWDPLKRDTLCRVLYKAVVSIIVTKLSAVATAAVADAGGDVTACASGLRLIGVPAFDRQPLPGADTAASGPICGPGVTVEEDRCCGLGQACANYVNELIAEYQRRCPPATHAEEHRDGAAGDSELGREAADARAHVVELHDITLDNEPVARGSPDWTRSRTPEGNPLVPPSPGPQPGPQPGQATKPGKAAAYLDVFQDAAVQPGAASSSSSVQTWQLLGKGLRKACRNLLDRGAGYGPAALRKVEGYLRNHRQAGAAAADATLVALDASSGEHLHTVYAAQARLAVRYGPSEPFCRDNIGAACALPAMHGMDACDVPAHTVFEEYASEAAELLADVAGTPPGATVYVGRVVVPSGGAAGVGSPVSDQVCSLGLHETEAVRFPLLLAGLQLHRVVLDPAVVEACDTADVDVPFRMYRPDTGDQVHLKDRVAAFLAQAGLGPGEYLDPEPDGSALAFADTTLEGVTARVAARLAGWQPAGPRTWPPPGAGVRTIVILGADSDPIATEVARALAGQCGPDRCVVAAVRSAVSCTSLGLQAAEGAAPVLAEVDVADPASLSHVLRGAATAVVFQAETPGMASQSLKIGKAARAAGVGRLCYVGRATSDARPRVTAEAAAVARWHAAAEAALADVGVPCVWVRAAPLMDGLRAFRNAAEVRMPLSGDAAVAFVSPADVVEAVVAVALQEHLRNRAFTITGPQPLTGDQILQAFQDGPSDRQPCTYSPALPPAIIARQGLLQSPNPHGHRLPVTTQRWLHTQQALVLGMPESPLSLAPTSDYHGLTGAPPRTLGSYLAAVAPAPEPGVVVVWPADSALGVAVVERLLASPVEGVRAVVRPESSAVRRRHAERLHDLVQRDIPLQVRSLSTKGVPGMSEVRGHLQDAHQLVLCAGDEETDMVAIEGTAHVLAKASPLEGIAHIVRLGIAAAPNATHPLAQSHQAACTVLLGTCGPQVTLLNAAPTPLILQPLLHECHARKHDLLALLHSARAPWIHVRDVAEAAVAAVLGLEQIPNRFANCRVSAGESVCLSAVLLESHAQALQEDDAEPKEEGEHRVSHTSSWRLSRASLRSSLTSALEAPLALIGRLRADSGRSARGARGGGVGEPRAHHALTLRGPQVFAAAQLLNIRGLWPQQSSPTGLRRHAGDFSQVWPVWRRLELLEADAAAAPDHFERLTGLKALQLRPRACAPNDAELFGGDSTAGDDSDEGMTRPAASSYGSDAGDDDDVSEEPWRLESATLFPEDPQALQRVLNTFEGAAPSHTTAAPAAPAAAPVVGEVALSHADRVALMLRVTTAVNRVLFAAAYRPHVGRELTALLVDPQVRPAILSWVRRPSEAVPVKADDRVWDAAADGWSPDAGPAVGAEERWRGWWCNFMRAAAVVMRDDREHAGRMFEGRVFHLMALLAYLLSKADHTRTLSAFCCLFFVHAAAAPDLARRVLGGPGGGARAAPLAKLLPYLCLTALQDWAHRQTAAAGGFRTDDQLKDEEALLFVALKAAERLYDAALLPVMLRHAAHPALLRSLHALPQLLVWVLQANSHSDFVRHRLRTRNRELCLALLAHYVADHGAGAPFVRDHLPAVLVRELGRMYPRVAERAVRLLEACVAAEPAFAEALVPAQCALLYGAFGMYPHDAVHEEPRGFHLDCVVTCVQQLMGLCARHALCRQALPHVLGRDFAGQPLLDSEMLSHFSCAPEDPEFARCVAAVRGWVLAKKAAYSSTIRGRAVERLQPMGFVWVVTDPDDDIPGRPAAVPPPSRLLPVAPGDAEAPAAVVCGVVVPGDDARVLVLDPGNIMGTPHPKGEAAPKPGPDCAFSDEDAESWAPRKAGAGAGGGFVWDAADKGPAGGEWAGLSVEEGGGVADPAEGLVVPWASVTKDRRRSRRGSPTPRRRTSGAWEGPAPFVSVRKGSLWGGAEALGLRREDSTWGSAPATPGAGGSRRVSGDFDPVHKDTLWGPDAFAPVHKSSSGGPDAFAPVHKDGPYGPEFAASWPGAGAQGQGPGTRRKSAAPKWLWTDPDAPQPLPARATLCAAEPAASGRLGSLEPASPGLPPGLPRKVVDPSTLLVPSGALGREPDDDPWEPPQKSEGSPEKEKRKPRRRESDPWVAGCSGGAGLDSAAASPRKMTLRSAAALWASVAGSSLVAEEERALSGLDLQDGGEEPFPHSEVLGPMPSMRAPHEGLSPEEDAALERWAQRDEERRASGGPEGRRQRLGRWWRRGVLG